MDSDQPTLRYEDVSIGDELPELVVPITPTAIIAGAIASRDYQDVHHDRDLAVERGSKDIFMNILTTNGYVARFITDWAGPEAMIRKIAIKLGAPAIPGQALRFTGEVTQAKEEGDECVVDVAVRAAADLGDHATGTVTVSLPLA
jgi:acyl dehydratase